MKSLLIGAFIILTFTAFAQNNVGIGTTTPINHLDILDNGIADSTTVILGLISDVSNRPALLFSEFATATEGSGMMLEYDGRLTGANNKLHIRGVDGGARFTFTSGGLLGIGTDEPATLLHLMATGSPSYSSIRMQNSFAPTHFWDIRGIVDDDPALSAFIINTSQGGNAMIIRGNSNVGIGTGYPRERIEIGASGRMFIGDGQDTVRTGLLIDGNEPGYYVRLHPYDYGSETDMNLYIPTPLTIGHGNAEPDSSVIFQVQSTERGILIPRMTLSQREAISTPEESLMVYQTDSTSGYWYFANGIWNRINKSTFLADADNDTKIQVEKNADEDVIRFDVGGTQRWIMTGRRLESTSGDGSIFIGANAGLNNGPEYTANVFIGNETGKYNTSGSLNVGIGNETLYFNTTGSTNTALGTSALPYNTTGSSNTAVGTFALYANTTGNYNSAFGTNTLSSNTTGFDNMAIGSSALSANTTGYLNTASGSLALHDNTTGYQNTAFGSSALFSNTTGNYNTASGSLALDKNTTGNHNTASGYFALRYNVAGINNAAYGSQALAEGTTGSSNSALGFKALLNNTGNQNSAVGYQALDHNTSGAWNCAFGANADVASNNLTYATAIGAYAVVGQSNSIVLGDPDQTIKVGIGTSTPTDLLTITGSDPRFFIGDTTSTGRRGLLIDGVEPGDYVRIHAYDYDPGTNLDINIPSDLLVGVWGGTTSYTLELAGPSGTAAKPGGGTWTSTSDRRLKQDIRDYSDGLDAVMQIRPVRYRYNALSGYNTETEYVGVIAQEIQEVAPYMVSTFEKNETEYLAVDNSAMTYLLINAVKEQQEQIKNQQRQIEDLLRIVSDLRDGTRQ